MTIKNCPILESQAKDVFDRVTVFLLAHLNKSKKSIAERGFTFITVKDIGFVVKITLSKIYLNVRPFRKFFISK